MKVHKQEILDGIRDRILGDTSIAYAVQMEKSSNTEFSAAVLKAFASKSKAAVSDGLYPTKSILVSTVWNLNDDIFDPVEAWLARSTPEDKPTNLDHDEKKIVGHITGNWPVTEAGVIIADDTAIDELPELFHIVNSAVIYTLWEDKELVERTEKLIAEIEDGTKFVSMECRFRGFDYAVIAPDKTYHVIARNSQTAFLTKHLRAYGGTGEYDGYRVGRLLRSIAFTGKGYVDKPANPSSVILKGEEFSFSTIKQNDIVLNNDGVLFFSTQSKLPESKKMDLEKLNSELNTKVGSLTTELASAATKIAELEKALTASKSEVTVATEKTATEAAKAEALSKELAEVKKNNETLSTELTTIKAAELKGRRVAKLVDGGLVKDEAEKKVAVFAALSDEQFDVVAESLVAAVKAAKKDVADTDVDPKADTTPTDATVVIDPKAAASEVKLGGGAENTETDQVIETRKAISAWFTFDKNSKKE
jgi:hypothetical protein